MLFNDLNRIEEIDTEHIFEQIKNMPEQIYQGWFYGLSQNYAFVHEIDHIVFIANGEEAICANLVKEYLDVNIRIPVTVIEGFNIPLWLNGNQKMVFVLSHTENTQETLSAYQKSIVAGCNTICVSSGGALIDFSQKNEQAYVQYPFSGKEDYVIGFLFGVVLAILFKIGVIGDLEETLDDLKTELNQIIKIHAPEILSPFNLAKRLAGQLVNRSVFVVGAQFLSPVARRWKTQINRCAKSWAQFETIPQLNLSVQEALYQQEVILKQLMVVFLQSDLYEKEIFQRIKSSKQSFMLSGIGTDQVDGKGNNLLKQMWSTLLFGDFVAYYLSIAYGVNPADLDNIEDFLTHLP